MSRKKFKIMYEVEFIVNGHPILERSIDEVVHNVLGIAPLGLVNEEESIKVKITKKQ